MTTVGVMGIAGQLPLAGVALHYLQYCLGLRDLGVEAFYLEDNLAWPYDPWENEPDREAAYTVPWLAELFEAFDVPWAYRDPRGRYHGSSERTVHSRCRSADLLLNISGGHWLEPHHRAARVLAYVDTDPGFIQVLAAQGEQDKREMLAVHDVLFTFAERIGRPGCKIPELGLDWKSTRQPVYLPFWSEVNGAPGDVYTTVMNWRAYGTAVWEGEEWGQKDMEFPTVFQLPRQTGLRFELALGGRDAPVEELETAGWTVVDPREPTRTVWTFRDYIAASRGEVTVAKQAYVRSRSGWFSERSANYLAAGRPVVAQDTGWSEALGIEAGDPGLLPFTTTEEAIDAVLTVERDPAAHAEAARALAARCFDATSVLERLLSDAGVT